MATHPTQAMLCIWHDVEAGHFEDYLRWHTFEHLPERLALPGFASARRYELVEGSGQRFFCVLDVRRLADLESQEYRARLDDPTPWTRRLMTHYGRVHRSLCRTDWSLGEGLTGRITCIRIAGTGDAALSRALADICRREIELQHLVTAQLGLLDPSVTNLLSEEKRLRRSEDSGGYDHVLLLGALSQQGLRQTAEAIESVLAPARLRMETSLYELSCALGQTS